MHRARPGFPTATMLALALLPMLAACPENPAGTPDSGTPATPAEIVLTRVGPGALDKVPGDRITLRAVASQAEVGPASGVQVVWTIKSDPSGASSLESLTGSTDSNGLVETELLVPSSTDGEPIVVRADAINAPGIVSRAVWNIYVAPELKLLQIVESSGVVITDPSANPSADANTRVSQSIVLRVKVVTSEGKTVENEPVTFVAGPSGLPSGTSLSSTTAVLSNALGLADVTLSTGTVGTTFKVLAQIGSGAYATFNVAMTGGGSGGGCQTSNDCSPGYQCSGNACVPVSTGGGSCGGPEDRCPLGYTCVSGVCQPAAGSGCDACPPCPANDPTCVDDGLHCDTATNTCVADVEECNETLPCPSGFDCVSGICIPGDGSLDVTGFWFTSHNFDVREGLPSWVRTLGTAVQGVNQAFLGQLNIPSWLNSIVRALVSQYIPEWVQQIVYVLDSLFELFKNLRAEGEMELAAVGGPRVLSGNELWTSFIFYFLPQCGTNVGGAFGEPRACARVDIYNSDLPADLAADVKPFAARLGGDSTAGYTLFVDRREVNMKFAGLLKYVLDKLLEVITGYPTLEESLPSFVDCVSLGQSIDDIFPIGGEALCNVAVTAATAAISRELQQQTITQDVLAFDGQATAKPSASIPTEASDLGFLDRLEGRGAADGKWNARFRAGISVPNVPGRWYGSRDPIPLPAN